MTEDDLQDRLAGAVDEMEAARFRFTLGGLRAAIAGWRSRLQMSNALVALINIICLAVGLEALRAAAWEPASLMGGVGVLLVLMGGLGLLDAALGRLVA